ncbi:alpha-D-glucose phosphate-specific phosphoglucomutase [Salinisphaera sp. T31B1]|uniref:alpha-D-glucose phosphate-specific phosphoglucomutase n=1 Tax=Salinisphaera sp. T31B1 TaxID=727963 RepID=UPI00333F201F
MSVDPRAGGPSPASARVDVSALCAAYVNRRPDPSVAAHQVAFGTTGHRGVAFDHSFNEWHVLAISQAICDYRRHRGIGGPVFVGIDTHALSQPALDTTLAVLAANEVPMRVAAAGQFTPTPAVSHAIVAHNRGPRRGDADGIVITPSHNPPEYGGYKYNPPHGGAAGKAVTDWIQARANTLLASGLQGVRHVPLGRARAMAAADPYDFLGHYVEQLDAVIDFDVIRSAGLRIGVDPMGGAGVHYWQAIAERYGLQLTVTHPEIDAQFGFIPLDWDGRIRMDPSSKYAMRSLIARKDEFDIALACDTDHDRHGIVTPGDGLLDSNHYLCVMIDYLFRHRSRWPATAGIGKTLVSTALIDRVARQLGRSVFEVPAGFKWFADGLADARLGFAGEESAGASFLQRDGCASVTDKDGIAPGLLAAEITARTGRDPGARYRQLTDTLGQPFAKRLQARANTAQKTALARLSSRELDCARLAGEPVTAIVDRAPGNNELIGGIKISTANGWFAARPSGTEDIYKLYAESLRSAEHLEAILTDARHILDRTLAIAPPGQAST